MQRTILLLILAILSGCSGDTHRLTIVDIALRNGDSKAYWVKCEWGGPDISPGMLSPGIEGSFISVVWPKQPSAKLTLTEDGTKIIHTLEVSLAKVNEDLKTGRFKHVTFKILNSEKAEAACD